MGGMMGGGGKSGGGGGGGGGGNTLADAFFAEQALGQNEQAVHNRYQQLGIGKPHTGTAAGAAATGQSLTYGGRADRAVVQPTKRSGFRSWRAARAARAAATAARASRFRRSNGRVR